MTILILTGPPAAGKNSIAPLVARKRKRCAIIDVDQVRGMLAQPHVAPWEGEEGMRQMCFGVENACLLASRFVEAGYEVLLLDFIWSYTVDIYRQQLALYNPAIIQLMPSLEESLRRNRLRGWLPVHEVQMLYAEMQKFTDFDERIDNTNLSVEEVAQRLIQRLDTSLDNLVNT